MENWLIALMAAAGSGGWIYFKMMRTTGNNTQTSVIIAVVGAIFLFMVFGMLFSMINS